MQATIKTIEVKDKWANIVLADGEHADKKLSGNIEFDARFATLKAGDSISYTVKNDKWINLDKEKKGFGGAPRDYTYEKKKTALECSVQLACAKILTPEQIIKSSEKFYEFLK